MMSADTTEAPWRPARIQWTRFRQDVARWIVLEEVAELSEVTLGTMVRKLWQHPPVRAMAWFRLASWMRWRNVRGLPMIVQQRMASVYGLELNPGDDIEGGFYIAHTHAVTIYAEHIGRNVTIVAAVTIGTRNTARWPRIGDGVYIGTGARIIGDIDLGDGSKVGANAVVMQDVPAGATAVGIPARILPPRRPALVDSTVDA